MIKKNVNLDLSLVCIDYLRMSSNNQNPRSPQQQVDEIRRVMQIQKRTWKVIKSFTDAGIPGAYIKRRPQFNEMLTAIRNGSLKVDAILVDTAERFGRADEIVAIRHELWSKYGVVVLTADSHFQDPTTMAGQALGMVEQFRSKGGNEVKAHDVWRGKRDLATQKKWPGGPAPLGKKITRTITTDAKGKELVESELVPDPETEWVVKLIFEIAFRTSKGAPKICKELNSKSDIPQKLKPFQPSKVEYVLRNPIYAGRLRWAEKCCGILNDTRVQQKNPDGPIIIDDFCTPIIPVEQFEHVQKMRAKRGDAIKAARKAAAAAREHGDCKQIIIVAAGTTLKYLLSGLVFCAVCHSRMVAGSGTGGSLNGTRYAYYRCPLSSSTGGTACNNRKHVREDKLRESVLGRIRQLLFPAPVVRNCKVVAPDWLPALDQQIRDELTVMQAQTPSRKSDLESQKREKDDQCLGLEVSLRKKDLPLSLRERLEKSFAKLMSEIDELDGQIRNSQETTQSLESILDVRTVLENLQGLHDVLAHGDVTDGNAQLSLHIEGIYCDADRNVKMRTCKLGIFAGAIEMLSRRDDSASKVTADIATDHLPGDLNVQPSPTARQYRVTSRRRPRLRISQSDSSDGAVERFPTTCHKRFRNLSPNWFWTDPVLIERRVPWAEANAWTVWQRHLQQPTLSGNKLAKAFPQASRPTVMHAMRIARERWGGDRGKEVGAVVPTPVDGPIPSQAMFADVTT